MGLRLILRRELGYRVGYSLDVRRKYLELCTQLLLGFRVAQVFLLTVLWHSDILQRHHNCLPQLLLAAGDLFILCIEEEGG